MIKQTARLFSVQMINLFGMNEIRYTRDKKKKSRFALMAVIWALLIALMIFYAVILSNAFVQMGMAEIIPIYLYMMPCIVILCFTFLKSGSIIFQRSSYEMLVSLPVSETAIVVSRFLTMYVTNLFLGAAVMIPGLVIYAGFMHPAFSFYIYSFLGILLLPMLPISVATIFGAGITAISSRMRHKSIISSVLTIGVVALIVVGEGFLGNMSETVTEDMIKDMAAYFTAQIGAVYPPAVWFGKCVTEGAFGGFLYLTGISLGVFGLLVFALGKCFGTVCSALNATSAKNTYKMQTLATSSPLQALWKRELKRYFASSIYVTNTLVGYVLMAAACIALFFTGPEVFESVISVPGAAEAGLPLLLGLMASIAPATSCSVSMEGKQWWIAQTLPVRSRDIWSAKILANLTLALPFYLVSIVFALLAVKPSVSEGIWLILLPAAYIVFSSVLGITMNLAFPVMKWEAESRVVKQSASVMLTMLVGFVTALIPVFFLVVLGVPSGIVWSGTFLLLVGAAVVLHFRNGKRNVFVEE